eukprot:TRINITY_DN9012_c0_g1_i1.p1 TRINITY_DN9012_c0_g1~~TRINITY_DN9012_c0_g1_i1.p1  ORF type:complete len:873 (+),score=184.60 TRINITY_DN9012_c0_g1_i1:81-2621(+)
MSWASGRGASCGPVGRQGSDGYQTATQPMRPSSFTLQSPPGSDGYQQPVRHSSFTLPQTSGGVPYPSYSSGVKGADANSVSILDAGYYTPSSLLYQQPGFGARRSISPPPVLPGMSSPRGPLAPPPLGSAPLLSRDNKGGSFTAPQSGGWQSMAAAPPPTSVMSSRGGQTPASPLHDAQPVRKQLIVPLQGGSANRASSHDSYLDPAASAPLSARRENGLEHVTTEILAIFQRMPSGKDGCVAKLDFMKTMEKDQQLADCILPGVDTSDLMSNEELYDKVDELFDDVTKGNDRLDLGHLALFFRKVAAEKTPKTRKTREIFDLIDVDGSGSISKLEFLAAMRDDARVDEFVMRQKKSFDVDDAARFAEVEVCFKSIARGKKRIEYNDFERYFRQVRAVAPKACPGKPRRETRVFVIGTGYGHQMNPRQGQVIEEAGYQVHWCKDLPNPEVDSSLERPMQRLADELAWFKPDVVTAASKGGVYLVQLWERGLWRGPSLMINAHPSCRRMPEGVPVVLCQGSNDEVYPTARSHLQSLRETGSPELCFLYYTANSGELQPGMYTRQGDWHNMQSIQLHDCLPRLIDASMCPEGPEIHFLKSWRDLVTPARLEAELWLGYCCEKLRELWSSPGHLGKAPQKLYDVLPGSEEFRRVACVFKANPKEQADYQPSPERSKRWSESVRIVRIQRVENGSQVNSSVLPYVESLQLSFEEQGMEFEPGSHTCWGFHGATREAIESIVTSSVSGFQPLASQRTLWGGGTYFARDALYVADSHFCGQAAQDGTRQMLMCLLATGVPCLGDPQHRGILPFRRKPYRYNSTVDSLSAPEVYIVQHGGAAYPAYVLTFAWQ